MERKLLISLIILSLIILTGCNFEYDLLKQNTAIPLITEIPTSTPTPTIIPSPTATPTPIPSVRILSGDQAYQNGDYDAALSSYQLAYELTNDEGLKSKALAMMGRIYYHQENMEKALSTLSQVAQNYSNPESTSMAYVYLAMVYTKLERPGEAATAYQSYLEISPGALDSYFLEKKGDALSLSGQYSEANIAYESALALSPVLPATALELKIAGNLAKSGDYDSAIQRYSAIQNNTTNDYIKAQAEFLIGQIYLNTGRYEEAYEKFQNNVNLYPRSYDSYSALVALVNNGVAVNNLNRGIVDYFAGQYEVGIKALNDYETEFNIHDGTSHYYKALSYTALGDYQNAIVEWDALINDHPGDRFWTTAWDEKAYTQWIYQGRYEEAAQTLLGFIASNSQDPLAPGFLFEAAKIYERGGFLDLAALTWERLASDYPSSEQSYSGIFLSGITRYRQQYYEAALSAFQRSLLLASTPLDTASAHLWIGKTQLILGDAVSAENSWQQAVQTDPTGYYSERARDLLINRPPFSACEVFDLATDLETEKLEAMDWMRRTFNLGSDVDLVNTQSLTSDPSFVRGMEFWRLGFWEEGRGEFEKLRIAYESDPVQTFRLTQFFYDIGLYRSSIFSARQVLTLGGLDDNATFNAPVYFNHIRFGAYYREIIMQAAQEENLDPLLLLSLIRQESLFEGFIQSSAGAQGLMQIMPATARETATNMGWPSVYMDNDIIRPYVNLRLGSHYLRRQIDYQNGDLYAALAGYNAGPGNAEVWKDLSNGDPDLYLEIVRYSETRQYIRSIVELYNIYRMFYCRAQ